MRHLYLCTRQFNQPQRLCGFAAMRQTPLATMQLVLACAICAFVACATLAHGRMECWARPYAAPGFLSDRRLFPSAAVGDPLWDGQTKVAFQNADCTWLAGNFRDTGSEAVFILFPAATIHKEFFPNPQLQQRLALEHNISSLAVDIAGRGESCGHEIGPGCTSTVIMPARWQISAVLVRCHSRRLKALCTPLQVKDMAGAARFVNSLPGRYCAGLFGEYPTLLHTTSSCI